MFVVILIFLFIIYYYYGGAVKTILSLGDEKETIENTFFTTEYVGTYYNNKFGETPQNCTKTNNNYNCKKGTNVEFYVGIINKGETKRYFYPAPCIIKDYSKGDDCKSDNAEYLTSYRPCGVEIGTAKATECVIGRQYTLETGTYRVFPGAKCLPEECFDPENPGSNSPKANYGSFLK